MSDKKKIVILGMGYVGLPAAILLARAGHQVVGVDINEDIVKSVNQGILHIDEEEFRAMIASPEVRANLRGTAQVEVADAYLIAVPTPLDNPRKIADLSMVRAACQSLVPHLRRGALVVLESTVPPLTCRKVITPILETSGLKVGKDILLAHCPERILPGRVFHEIVHNDRIIGGVDQASIEAARALYSTFVEGELVQTDDVTAELCKLMENTYRDVNIALANELASVCDALGVDVHRAIDIANRHPRVDHPAARDRRRRPLHRDRSLVHRRGRPRIERDHPDGAADQRRTAGEDRGPHPAGRRRRAPSRGWSAWARHTSPTPTICASRPRSRSSRCCNDDGYDVRLVDPLTREYPCESLAEAARGCDLAVMLVPTSA